MNIGGLMLPDLIATANVGNCSSLASFCAAYEARRRKLVAEAAMAELSLAFAEGAAVAIEDIHAGWAGVIGTARAKVLAIGSKLGPTLAVEGDPTDCQAIVDAAIGEALQELSETEPERSGENGAESAGNKGQKAKIRSRH